MKRTELYEIIQHLNDALYITALNDEMEVSYFVEVNQAACEQLGYSRSEFLTLSPYDIIDSSYIVFGCLSPLE